VALALAGLPRTLPHLAGLARCEPPKPPRFRSPSHPLAVRYRVRSGAGTTASAAVTQARVQRAHAAVTGLGRLDVLAGQRTRLHRCRLVGPTNGFSPRRWSALHARERALRREFPELLTTFADQAGRLLRAGLAVRAHAQPITIAQAGGVGHAVFVTRQESVAQAFSQRRSGRILSR